MRETESVCVYLSTTIRRLTGDKMLVEDLDISPTFKHMFVFLGLISQKESLTDQNCALKRIVVNSA